MVENISHSDGNLNGSISTTSLACITISNCISNSKWISPKNKYETDDNTSLAVRIACDTIQTWLPGGYFDGDEYKCLSPFRQDSSIGSFSVNVCKGTYHDFATGESGGILELHRYAHGLPTIGATIDALCGDYKGVAQAYRPIKMATKSDADKYARAASEAQRIYAEAIDATSDHGYLHRKGLQPAEGLKCVHGELVIPYYNTYRLWEVNQKYDEIQNIVTLQFIDGNGNKRFLKGGKAKGSFSCFPIPLWTAQEGFHFYVVEGYADAASVVLADASQGVTSTAFIVGSATWMIDSIATILKAFSHIPYLQDRMVIIADNDDAGIKAAREASQLYNIPFTTLGEQQ